MRAEHLFSSCEYDKKRKRCFGKLLGDWGTCFRQKSMFLVIVGRSRSFKMLLEILIENSVGLVDEPGLQSIEQVISPYLWRKGLALECSESAKQTQNSKTQMPSYSFSSFPNRIMQIFQWNFPVSPVEKPRMFWLPVLPLCSPVQFLSESLISMVFSFC